MKNSRGGEVRNLVIALWLVIGSNLVFQPLGLAPYNVTDTLFKHNPFTHPEKLVGLVPLRPPY